MTPARCVGFDTSAVKRVSQTTHPLRNPKDFVCGQQFVNLRKPALFKKLAALGTQFANSEPTSHRAVRPEWPSYLNVWEDIR